MEQIRLGPFRLLSAIGKGAMEEVWRAVHPSQKTPVAIKFVQHGTAHNQELRAALRGEIQSIARLHHPHIVAVYDCGEIDADVERQSEGRFKGGQPYLAMEYVNSGSLPRHRSRLRFNLMPFRRCP